MKAVKFAAVVAILTVAALASSCSKRPKEWVKIQPYGEDFSVLMPEDAVESIETRMYSGNPYECHAFKFYSKNKHTDIQLFEIDYIDAKGIGQYESEDIRKVFVARLTQEREQYFNSPCISRKKINIAGFPADEVVLMNPGDDLFYIIRFFIANDKIFSMLVAIKSKKINPTEMGKFFDSFTIKSYS